MPEIIHQRQQAEQILSTIIESRGVPSSLKRDGVIISSGDENVVFQAPQSPDKVYALTYWTPLKAKEAKSGFYAHKVLSTLFPYNFPRIHAAYGERFRSFSPDGFARTLTGTVREKIEGADDDTIITHPFTDVTTFLKEMGQTPQQVLDDQQRNYMIGADGGEYYSDFIRNTAGMSSIAPDRVVDWMRSHKVTDKKTGQERAYTEQEMRTVVHSFNRMQDLSPFGKSRLSFRYVDDGEET